MTLPSELARALQRLREERRFDAARVLAAKSALVEEYFARDGLTAAVVGVSGGVDSAVVVAILAHAMRQPGSSIRKVVAALAPMFVTAGATNQDAALAKGREVALRFGVDTVVVDLTGAIAATKDAVDAGLRAHDANAVAGDAWADGQLVSVMRTPAFYYLAARLQQDGMPSLVVGTTNRDEGSYIGFFGKASDGMVDLQILSDLHKSEVYALAALLDVPASVRTAVPAGDVFDGRSDVEMIGAPYDFVELYTGLRATGVDVDAFAAALTDSDARTAFAAWARAIEELHAKNAHKYVVGSPAVHLDVLARGVPGGWPSPAARPRDPVPPPAAFVGGRAFAIDRSIVARVSRARTRVVSSRAADFGDSVRVLDNVLDVDEAASLAAAANDACAVAVGVHGRVDAHGRVDVHGRADVHGHVDAAIDAATTTYGVGSRRASAWDEELARALWLRIAQHLPVARVLDARTPTDDFGSRVWRPIGLSPLFRFMAYDEGGLLVEHEDEGFVYPDGERATLMSVVLVLAGVARACADDARALGGATRLLRDPDRHLRVRERRHHDDERVGQARDVLFAHAPREGSALVLDHRVRHDGEPWRGPGAKIIVRTDVVFERCGARPFIGGGSAPFTPVDGATESNRFEAQANDDPLYGALWRRYRDAKVLDEAGFFDDGAPLDEPADARADPAWLVTPVHKLAHPGDDDAPLAVLVSTGGFCPVHRGHVEMMEEAKRALQARGVRVLGGYLAPDHDQYVRLKVGDDAPSSEHRLHLCERAVADSDWLMIDPWPAVHAARSLNFSTVITRLARYVSAHVRCARPVRVYYVFGGDNARFSLALAHGDSAGVCVNRVGHEATLARYRADARVRGARDLLFVDDARPAGVASRDVRAGDDGPLAAPVRDVWRSWREPQATLSRALVYVRDEGEWSTAPWRDGRDGAALAAAWTRFVEQLHAALKRAFVDARGPDQRHEIRVEFLRLDEQRARADAAIARAAGRVISLDPCVSGTVNVGLSRCFPLCDQSGAPRIGERPGWPPLAAQLAAVTAGAWTLLDDDVVTGRTIARMRDSMPTGAHIADVVFLCDASSAPDAEVVDLVDARDFLCGAREGGLVVMTPDGNGARAPYLLPYVRPAHRVSAPISSERSFSRDVWRANVELFAAVTPALRLRDGNDAFRALMHYVGFNNDDTLEHIARWHLTRLT